jgi:hypothetical protein
METLLFMRSDFAHSAEREPTEEDGNDLDSSCEFDNSDAEPLGRNLFRVLAPIAVTPLAPWDPD